VIIFKFIRPLESATQTDHPILSKPLIKSIFSNIEIIFNFNSLLFEGISGRMRNWNATTKLGDIFVALTDFLPACYIEYVNHYDTAIDTLIQTRKENAAFDEFIKKQEQTKECHFQPLESFLVMPVQQIPRYVMLLADLVRNTPKEHVDYQDLEIGLSKMKEVASKINEKKRDSESMAKVFAIQRSLVGNKIPSLCIPSRRHIKEGPVSFLEKFSVLKKAFCYLFNDLFVLATLTVKGHSRYKAHISIDSTFHITPYVGDKKVGNGMVLAGNQDDGKKTIELVVFFESQQQWVQEIEKLISQHSSKK